MPPHELAFFVERLMVFLTSCDERRFGQWENVQLAGVRPAETKSKEYQKVARRGADPQPRRRQGDGREHPHDRQHGRGVRLQHHGPRQRRRRRPRPRPAHQRGVDRPVGAAPADLGVRFSRRPDGSRGTVVRRADHRGRLARGPPPAAAPRSRPTGSSARCRPSGPGSCWSRDGRCASTRRSRRMDDLFTDWMAGIQFYLRRPVDITRGHITFIDAPWALTALNQAQFWADRDFAARLRRRRGGRLPLRRHLRLGRARGPLRQAGQALHTRRDRPRGDGPDPAAPHRRRRSCPTGSCTPGSSTRASRGTRPRGRNTNATPLLVNTVGSWDKRPRARTRIPNLFLAGDYVRTDIDLATMEGANESGRAAANALLDAAGSRADRATMYRLYDPPEFDRPQGRRRRALPAGPAERARPPGRHAAGRDAAEALTGGWAGSGCA